MKKWIAFISLTLIFVIFAAVIDEAISGIALAGLRYAVRVIWLFTVMFVLGMLPRPTSS
jgi:uncharacterized membrane protein